MAYETNGGELDVMFFHKKRFSNEGIKMHDRKVYIYDSQ